MRILLKKNEIFEKIDVVPPYFALENLEIDDEKITYASIPTQQKSNGEESFMCCAEIGRHLAILGSCAVSFQNPVSGKHYYLAYKAEFTLCDDMNKICTIRQPYYKGTSKGTMLDKKTGFAHCTMLSEDNEVLCELDVYYYIIKKDVFDRLNKKYAVENFYSANNPYLVPLKLQDTCIENGKIFATIGEVKQEWCSGHFPQIPALPVAIVVYNLVNCVSIYLIEHLKNSDIKFVVKKVFLLAEKLAFHTEIVNFECVLINNIKNAYSFECKAYTNNMASIGFADMQVELL